MTGPQHFQKAERLLVEQGRCRVTDEDGGPCPICAATLAKAQVHATLALAAATALGGVILTLPESSSLAKGWVEVLR